MATRIRPLIGPLIKDLLLDRPENVIDYTMSWFRTNGKKLEEELRKKEEELENLREQQAEFQEKEKTRGLSVPIKDLEVLQTVVKAPEESESS